MLRYAIVCYHLWNFKMCSVVVEQLCGPAALLSFTTVYTAPLWPGGLPDVCPLLTYPTFWRTCLFKSHSSLMRANPGNLVFNVYVHKPCVFYLPFLAVPPFWNELYSCLHCKQYVMLTYTVRSWNSRTKFVPSCRRHSENRMCVFEHLWVNATFAGNFSGYFLHN